MSKRFDPPDWCTKPTEEFFFEILKEGAIVGTVPLDKLSCTFGRNADICDVPLEHQTISRVHAAAVFRSGVELMLIDLGSAHGTRVNKKPIIPNEYIRLMVGDLVAFGSSSRLYIVNGPSEQQREEYDSVNVQRYRRQLADRAAKAEKAKAEEESSGIDWGFREDAVNDEEDEAEGDEDKANLPDYIKNDEHYDRKYGKKYSSTVDESEVHEKDKAILEKIRAKERKIQNMQEENRRIYMKENSQDSGLTEGQSAAVSRNDKRIETLVGEIEEMTHKITSKNVQRQAQTETAESLGTKGSASKAGDKVGIEEDTYDTTMDTADVSTNWRLQKKLNKQRGSGPTGSGNAGINTVVTYESLVKERDAELAVLTGVRQQMETERKRLQRQQPESPAADTEGVVFTGDDALEGYLRDSLVGEVDASLRKLGQLETAQNGKLQKIERLLKIATPAIASLAPTPKPVATTLVVNTALVVTAAENNPVVEILVPRQKEEERKKINEIVQQPLAEECIPVHAPSISVPEQRAEGEKISTKAVDKLKRKLPSVQESKVRDDISGEAVAASLRGGVDSADQINTSSSVEPPKKKIATVARGPLLPRKATTDQESGYSFDGSKLQGGDSAWVPPTGQTGDGRSSLNDKYGY